MLQAQTARPSRSPQQRFATIAVVAGLHLAVVFIVLNAFTRAFQPVVVPITHVRILPQTPTTVPARKNIPPNPKLARPQTEKHITPPPIPPSNNAETEEPANPDHGSIAANPGTSQSVFVAPQAIGRTHTIPPYPPLEIRLGREGNVLLKLLIDERGVVVNAAVERSSGNGDFDRTAVDWVKANWRYQPATQDGKAITSSADALVRFQLTGLR